MMSYNDDRPGMMRVHIASRRAHALAAYYTRDSLREMARRRQVAIGYPLKSELAFALALDGAVAPDYDKASEATP